MGKRSTTLVAIDLGAYLFYKAQWEKALLSDPVRIACEECDATLGIVLGGFEGYVVHKSGRRCSKCGLVIVIQIQYKNIKKSIKIKPSEALQGADENVRPWNMKMWRVYPKAWHL